MAVGPRTQQQLQQQTKGWLNTFSQWVSGSKKPATQGNSTDSGKPEKVSNAMYTSVGCGKGRQVIMVIMCFPLQVVDSDDKLRPEGLLN